MIPAAESLTVPDGIRDASTTALVQLLEERMGNIPVERALVWHAPSTPAAALRHIAEALGLTEITWLGGLPPSGLIARGVGLLRRRGTVGALRDALDLAGYADAEIQESPKLRYDGTITHSGQPWLHGHDARWFAFRVWLERGAALSDAEAGQLVDVIGFMARAINHFAVVVELTSGAYHVYRDDGAGGGAWITQEAP